VLAILQIPHHIQTWLLYHNALSTDVVVSNILRYARKSQESGGAATAPNEDLIEQIAELRKIVQKQEQTIELLGSGGKATSATTRKHNPSTDAIASLIMAPSPEPMSIHQNPVGGYSRSGMVGRTVSASTLDVWGEMAFGDSGAQAGYDSAPVTQRPTTMARANDFSFTQPDVMPPR
jgi:callose synthase